MRVSRIEKRKSVSLGADLRMESERLVGSGLEFEEQILQLSVFSAGNGNGRGGKTKMKRASARRESQRK
jgi:hypothetical protein